MAKLPFKKGISIPSLLATLVILSICIGIAFIWPNYTSRLKTAPPNKELYATDSIPEEDIKPQTESSASPFKLALPGYQYRFPQDHASHPEFKTEWWYYTGHLQATDSDNNARWFGYELTFFRSATGLDTVPKNPEWGAEQFYMAHAALTDEQGKQFYHTLRLNRDAPGGHQGRRAGASTKGYSVWNENWHAQRTTGGQHQLKATTPDFGLTLNLSPLNPPTVHGTNGVSQKAACTGCASHYYSYPTMPTSGTITIGGTSYSVTGSSWMDHEFGSNQLQKNQVGWDWFSVQLNNGDAIMLYVMRRDDGSWDPYSSGTWINKSGKATHLSRDEFLIHPKGTWVSPHTKGTYPSGWTVTIPARNLTLDINPVMKDQELTSPIDSALAYWEGRCRVSGKLNNESVSGNAYVELTGYAKAFKQAI